jgi:hypothetical protein
MCYPGWQQRLQDGPTNDPELVANPLATAWIRIASGEAHILQGSETTFGNIW